MRAMKDSGVEWIGEIPVGWDLRKLGHLLINIGSGTTPKAMAEYYNGEISWLNTGDLNDGYISHIEKTVSELAVNEHSALKLYPKNSVVIALYGATIGKLGIITSPTTTNQACCVMTCNTDLIPSFLYYSLFGMRSYILTLSYGAGQPNISANTIRFLQIVLPPPNEQHEITAYLDKKCAAIDSAIENQRATIDKLKEYRQAVITEAVTKGLNPDVPMKDSGVEWIGEIPEGWDVVRFSYVAQIAANLVDPKNYPQYIHVAPNNIEKDTGVLLECQTVEEDGVDSDNHHFYRGQILYSKVRPKLNKVVIAPFDGLCSADMYPIQTQQLSAFLLYYMISNAFTEQITISENRVKMPKINKGEMAELLIVVPPKAHQSLIVSHLDCKCTAIDSAVSKKETLIEKLTEYKKSLIYEAVTGKIEVPELCGVN